MLETSDPGTVQAFFWDRLQIHNSQDFRGILYAPENSAPIFMDDVAVGISYNAFVGRTCSIHCVIQKKEFFTRRIIADAFAFPFVRCNCEAVIATIDSNNAPSLELVRRLGFKEIARVPNGGHEADLVILQMLRGECRWLRPH
jgi:RimJ/RimL family protein N-acetyltransferase